MRGDQGWGMGTEGHEITYSPFKSLKQGQVKNGTFKQSSTEALE